MKAVTSSALSTFLASTTEYVRADLYSFTLQGGSILRYCSTNMPVKSTITGLESTYYWNLGPPIQDAGVQSVPGVGGSSVEITILGGHSRFTVAGVDILDFLDGHGPDGASVSIDRAFAATWNAMSVYGPVGSYCRFNGQYKEGKALGNTQAVVVCKSPLSLLGTPYPPETFGTSCNNVFGDANCGVNLSGLTKTGLAGNGTLTAGAFGSSLAQADGYWNLGSITFTSGVNSGLSRTIKTYAASYGLITRTAPFPAAPANEDAFSIAPGCPLSLAACQAWDAVAPAPTYTYKRRFRASPWVPPPTTGLPS